MNCLIRKRFLKETILLFPEQGVGDEIMFSSCVMDLTKVANGVVLVCDARLKPVFERSFPGVTVVGQTQKNNISNNPTDFIDKLPVVDVQLSVASLPMYFRNNIQQFGPASDGYLLADTRAIEKWNGVLPTYNGGGAVPFIDLK